MADILNLAMLVCASLGAMAFGILTAYAILRATFAFMRPRRMPVPASVPAKTQTEAARTS